MVVVTPETFLGKVTAFYKAEEGSKGSVVITCKSVPAAKIHRVRKSAEVTGEHVLLFRAYKYGNNHHKQKYSTVITPADHAGFYASLSQIVKTKIDASVKEVSGNSGAKRVAKVKKTTE